MDESLHVMGYGRESDRALPGRFRRGLRREIGQPTTKRPTVDVSLQSPPVTASLHVWYAVVTPLPGMKVPRRLNTRS